MKHESFSVNFISHIYHSLHQTYNIKHLVCGCIIDKLVSFEFVITLLYNNNDIYRTFGIVLRTAV